MTTERVRKAVSLSDFHFSGKALTLRSGGLDNDLCVDLSLVGYKQFLILREILRF